MDSSNKDLTVDWNPLDRVGSKVTLVMLYYLFYWLYKIFIHVCLIYFMLFLGHWFLTNAKIPSLPYYLPVAGERIVGFIPFTRVLALCETQTDSSRIWTRVAVSISFEVNHYVTAHSKFLYIAAFSPNIIVYRKRVFLRDEFMFSFSQEITREYFKPFFCGDFTTFQFMLCHNNYQDVGYGYCWSISIWKKFRSECRGARGQTVIVVGSDLDHRSSNPGRGCQHFHITLMSLGYVGIQCAPSNYE